MTAMSTTPGHVGHPVVAGQPQHLVGPRVDGVQRAAETGLQQVFQDHVARRSSGLRLAPITATDRGCSTARTLSASAECSRASRTSSDSAVGAMSKPSAITPSSYRWVIS